MNCLDCALRTATGARPAVATCVTCGAGVCLEHAKVRVGARSGSLSAAFTPPRTIRCATCTATLRSQEPA